MLRERRFKIDDWQLGCPILVDPLFEEKKLCR